MGGHVPPSAIKSRICHPLFFLRVRVPLFPLKLLSPHARRHPEPASFPFTEEQRDHKPPRSGTRFRVSLFDRYASDFSFSSDFFSQRLLFLPTKALEQFSQPSFFACSNALPQKKLLGARDFCDETSF